VGGYQVGEAPLGADNGGARAYYQECWRAGFMPTTSAAAVGRWVLATHAGELMSYPAGDRNGASTLTLLLFLAGAWWCGGNRPHLLALCLPPFGLALAASALRKYPYGAEPRLDQHLAPFICLLVGAGGAALLEAFARTPVGRLRGAWVACGLLAGCAVAVSFMGTSKPAYWEREALWSRRIANELRGQASVRDQVVVLEAEEQVLPTLRWQLGRLGSRVCWGGKADWERLAGSDNRLWLISVRSGPERSYAHGITIEGGADSPLWAPYGAQRPARPVRSELDECLRRGGQAWAPVDHVTYTLQDKDPDAPPVRCDLFLCCRKGQTDTRPHHLLSSWPR
jgi:hypothetical protein